MKKLIALILLLSLFLVSCGGEKTPPAETDAPSEDDVFADLVQKDCSEFVFRILNARTSSPASHMDAEEYTGDVIDDEVFARNLRVEEKLNAVIEEERESPQNVFDKTVNSVLAGDGMYSAVFTTPDYMGALALEGYILPHDRLKGINTKKPWWNIKASEDVSVAGEMYMLFGDIQLSFYDAHSIVGFNMDIVSETDGIADPYKLAGRGEWTLDSMFNMIRSVSADVDGNGERTFDDRYGAVSDGSEIIPLLEGAGKTIVTSRGNGVPEVTCHADESFYDTFMLISDMMYPRSGIPCVYDTVKNSADNYSAAAYFLGGNALFFVTDVGHLYPLREMEHEFGLLPMPKADPAQENYISYIRPDSVTALGIPAVLREAEYTFAVLENLAAESYRAGGTREKYLDSVLQFRYVNDEQSRIWLDTVLEGGVFDRGEIYDFGGAADALKKLCRDPDTYSSEMAKAARDALTDIKETMEKIAEK